jgi:hypothetical protein
MTIFIQNMILLSNFNISFKHIVDNTVLFCYLTVLVGDCNSCDSAGHLSARPYPVAHKSIWMLLCVLCRIMFLCCKFLFM